jgi:DNA-binding MarR family transcriptional regulator
MKSSNNKNKIYYVLKLKEKKMAALKENSRKVFDYVKSVDGQNVTAADIAEATGLEVRSVNGIVTSAFQRKGLMERVPSEIELEDGTHKAVKFIRLTDEGRAFDPDVTEQAE